MSTPLEDKLQWIFSKFNTPEAEDLKSELIDSLESSLLKLQEAAQRGDELVSDGVYDTLKDYLQQIHPSSPVLKHVWSADDPNAKLDDELDRFLKVYPMLSIQTIKAFADKAYQTFKSSLPRGVIRLFVSAKLNGHGIRIVWKDGNLVKATSRGRSTTGRDLTAQMKLILGSYNPHLADLGLVEGRAEAVLPFYNLDKARQYNPNLKSAFTAVSSVIRASAAEEETKLLDIVFYDILSDKLSFSSLSEKYYTLESWGFKIPYCFPVMTSAQDLDGAIDRALIKAEEDTKDYQYYMDGLVIAVDSTEHFMAMGQEESFRYGNVAIKMGKWKQDNYSGVVSHIKWEKGKSKRTPVAVLEGDGVLTATGNKVVNVPLYAPVYILLLEAYEGNTIHFKYGGEAGVVPLTSTGELVTELELPDNLL